MKRTNKLAIWAAVLVVAGLVWLLYPAQGTLILEYHKICEDTSPYAVAPAEFDKQLQYLADEGYTTISMKEYAAAAAGQGVLPAKPVVITFDDGYDNNYTEALPLLERHGMKGTVFVVSGYVEQYPGYLSWPQILEMQRRGMEIGSHTANHVQLDTLSPDEQRKEITESKAVLEQHIGRPVEFLAYPFGGYTAETEKLLKEVGYAGACTGEAGLNRGGDKPYALKRVYIPNSRWGLWEFKLRLWRAIVFTKLGL